MNAMSPDTNILPKAAGRIRSFYIERNGGLPPVESLRFSSNVYFLASSELDERMLVLTTDEVIEMANTGKDNPGNFANDREKASEAGKKGGQASGGNFANDPERASEVGQKGGQASGGRQASDSDQSSGGQGSGQGGNFANDREKASEAGRKGGEQSGGGNRKS
jgi:general stress protein YciG